MDQARWVLDDLDSVRLADMTALYYANGFESLSVVLRDLLEALDADGAENRFRLASHSAHELDRLPRLNAALEHSAGLRVERVNQLARGARFRGLDELLSNLDKLRIAFAGDKGLHQLSFMIDRCIADFETAIENGLSGYLSVAMDAMRDVMEIENLLLDFAVDPHHIGRWLRADARALRTTYSPAEVRNRLHRAQVGAYASSAEAPDYRAHSQALHVRPDRHPVAEKGFSAENGRNGDAAYWEIFEHHRRLREAIARLVTTLSSDSEGSRLATCEPPAVRSAWERTQEMQTMYPPSSPRRRPTPTPTPTPQRAHRRPSG